MNFNMPGAFPGSIAEEPEQQFDGLGGPRAPSTSTFNFTPSRSGIGQRLYPSFHNSSHMASSQAPSLSLQQECNDLGYSKKLSNNVLDELDKRAATKVLRSSHISSKSVLSPRSSRYNSSHRSKFQKMESISNHYATIRTKASSSSLRREEVEMEKENVSSYDPNSKRTGISVLEGASKRRRTATGRQEVITPQSRAATISHRMPTAPTHHYGASRIPRSPSKANLQDTTMNSRTVEKSTSSMSLQKKVALPHSRTVSQNISQLTSAKQLPRSSTLQNLTKPTASSIQRSSSNRNLGQSLRPQPSLSSISSSSTTTHTIPRMRSNMNLKQSGSSKPVWR